MTILLTGGCGFVAGHLLPALEKLGDAIVVTYGAGVASGKASGSARTEWVTLDVTDVGAVDRLIASKRPDQIVHLAARSSVKASHSDARDTFEVNCRGSIALFEAIRRHAPGAVVVFASSSEIYGTAFASTTPVTEKSPVFPANAYARSKLAAEIALHDLLGEVSPVIALRLFNHTGPGQDERFVVPSFAAQIARIETGLSVPMLQVGDLTAERDFCDVADVVDAYLRALLLGRDGNGFRVYNIASGTTRTVGSILNDLVERSTARFTVAQDPTRMRPSSVSRAACNVSAFTYATGWSPKRKWSDTIESVMQYWRTQAAEPKR